MPNENLDPENAKGKDDTVEADFENEVLLAPTALERELGREVDEEETAYIQAAMKFFGTDATRAAAAFALFCSIRREYE